MNRENLALDLERLSDTVVDRVLRTGEPLLVSDATADPEFSASTSVVNLKLSSVLCVPLMHRARPLNRCPIGARSWSSLSNTCIFTMALTRTGSNSSTTAR